MKSLFLSQVETFLVEKYGEAQGMEISKKAYNRFEELCKENELEIKAMHIHTRDRIYPAIATFDALLSSEKSREEASDFVIKYYTWRSTIMGKKINKFMKFPFLYKFAPKICRILTSKMFSEDAGFKAQQYQTPKNEVRFDMLECIYAKKCNEYGCPEIVKAYCNADDICFGNMHEKVDFSRTKTLANNDDCCDFSFKI